MRQSKFLISVISASAIVLAADAAGAADFSPELQALIKAANAEGAVDLTWNPRTMAGTRGAKRMEKELNALFGSKISIRYTPGASIPAVGNKLTMEHKANRQAHTDLYMSSSRALAVISSRRKIFLSAPWQKFLPDRITDEMVSLGGTGVKLVTIVPAIAYNSKLAPMRPKTLADMLHPAWKGKIASTPYVANFDMLSGTWGVDKATAYARSLSGQLAGLMRCNENSRLASGEYIALVMDCNSQNANIAKEEGAPLDFVVPTDFPVVSYFNLSVPAHAKHPNSAKLVTTFLMTPEGQKFMWETWKADLHLFPESRIKVVLADVLKRKLVNVDAEWHMAHPEARKGWFAIRKIITAKKK